MERGKGGGRGALEMCIRHLVRLHKGSRRQASHVLHKAAHRGQSGAAPHQQHLTDGGPPLRPQLCQRGRLPLALAPPLLRHLLICPDRPQIHPCLHALPAPVSKEGQNVDSRIDMCHRIGMEHLGMGHGDSSAEGQHYSLMLREVKLDWR